MTEYYERALKYLKQMIGDDKEFREGQWKAIESVVLDRKRVVIVQRTGWGKSIVYFLATKLLREQGFGPTILISPLLSLMRNQIQAAERIGIRALTINSTNEEQWDEITKSIVNNNCDLVLISPERLKNKNFIINVLTPISQKLGLLVVDEVHCISDWGHDFRTDYRRIAQILNLLPNGIPVIGTTATANNRVVEDIKEQFGTNLEIVRGPLVRSSLRLYNLIISSQAERLAWLAEKIPGFDGSGIIYCLTRKDTEKVANWLKQNGIKAESYVGGIENAEELEQKLLDNQIKVLVATVALGMGFDKPDLGFVIHYQRPGSVVAYYQQVGRAGRAIENAYGIILNGNEDDEISDYFIRTAFPPAKVLEKILDVIEKNEGLSVPKLEKFVNTSPTVLKKSVELLEIEGAISKDGSGYFRTANKWQPNLERIQKVTNQRYVELKQMRMYMEYEGCLMEFLERALDDPSPQACGKCENCTDEKLSIVLNPDLLIEAQRFLSNLEIVIEPRKQYYNFKRIEKEFQVCFGRALCFYMDSGFGELVHHGKYSNNHFDEKLINASVDLIKNHWEFSEFRPEWVTAIPSKNRPKLVYDFAEKLAHDLELPFIPVFDRSIESPPQKIMENSALQAENVQNSLILVNKPQPGSVLLVDDIIDSRWTMTIAGKILRENGSGLVYPFALACVT